MPCYLHILGESFDPATAPRLLGLEPFASFRRGDPNPGGGSGFTEVGGVTCEVSPRQRMIDLVGQATGYLVRHREVLETLEDHESIQYRTLAFYIGKNEFQTIGSRMMMPSLLIGLCAELKLGVCFEVQ
jgi:hypothetical protein